MKHWTRRDLLKTGVALPAAAALGATPAAADGHFLDGGSASTAPGPAAGAGQAARPAAPVNSAARVGRDRDLLDSGWRFHFGHASDGSKDFGFGNGRSGGFQKTGDFLAPSSLAFDDGDWTPVDLPHDWVVGLPFQNDPSLSSKGFYPLGREYPDTSVGWYRRVFELPASDAGRRITIEFDGAYRDTMVVFNGCYIGRHGGGYDPFSFDVTDFATPGGRNVLLVRVDATLSDGWFYEGAGLYRHVWLVRTAPLHVKKWGTLARATVKLPGVATVGLRTELENHGRRSVPCGWCRRFSTRPASRSAGPSPHPSRCRSGASAPPSSRSW